MTDNPTPCTPSVNYGLEPECRRLHQGVSSGDGALFSIAISLKRIADLLSAEDRFGLAGVESLANAIRVGLQQGRGS